MRTRPLKGGALAVLLGLGACATRPGLGGAVQQGQVQRVETYLNGLHGVRAHFVQTWPDGGTGGGTMAYDPGHMRLDYVSPHGMQMVAGEGHLTLHDDQNGSLTRVALSRNPLGMLLRVPLHLSGDIRVTAVQAQPGSLQLTLVRTDAPTEGALTLTFSDSAGQLALVGLQGVDARQHRIVLHLTDVTEGATLPASLFTPPSG